MNFPADLKYTKDHEWIRVEGDVAYVGITDYAQGELGEIVYVCLLYPSRRACVFPVNAAKLAVIVVPIFSPNTKATPK